MIKRGQVYRAIYGKHGRLNLHDRYCVVVDPCGYKRRIIVQTCDANGRSVLYGHTRGLTPERLETSYALHKDIVTVEKRSASSVGLNNVMNQYQPRKYDTDTPAEAKARRAGFEAGRQYEASLRDASVCEDEGCPHFGTDHIHVQAPA